MLSGKFFFFFLSFFSILNRFELKEKEGAHGMSQESKTFEISPTVLYLLRSDSPDEKRGINFIVRGKRLGNGWG